MARPSPDTAHPGMAGATDGRGVWCELADLIALRGAGSGGTRRTGSGQHSGSALPGARLRPQGTEFEEVRPYQAGEDARHIDWRVSARHGQPHIRLFREERNQPQLLLLDQSATLFFGSRRCFKSVLAAEWMAQLAWAAEASGQPLGGMIVEGGANLGNSTGSGTVQMLPAASGQRAVLRLLHAAIAANRRLQPRDDVWPGDGVAQALARWRQRRLSGCVLSVISDINGLGGQALTEFAALARHNSVSACLVWDPLERDLPAGGWRSFAGSGGRLRLDCGDAGLRQRYRDDFDARLRQLRAQLSASGIALHTRATSDAAPGRPRARATEGRR